MTDDTGTRAWQTVETMGVKPGDTIVIHYVEYISTYADEETAVCVYVATDNVGIYVRSSGAIEFWPWTSVHKLTLSGTAIDAAKWSARARSSRSSSRLPVPPLPPPIPEPPPPYKRPHP
jgi:hypothetical protein